MLDCTLLQLAGLCAFAFLAGFIDSIAGGGGLIQLPAALTFLPHLPVVSILGINKVASVCGTAVATAQYARKVKIEWKMILPIAAFALTASTIGARTAIIVPNHFMRPVVVILLGCVILFTLIKKNVGKTAVASRYKLPIQIALGLLAGSLIGFYDGFFGPGTGNFLILSFIFIFGLDFLRASASSKVVNLATNLGAAVLFLFQGVVNLPIALSMAVFNIAGNALGSRLAILKGSGFIRILFLVVISGLFCKQLYELIVIGF